MSHLHKGDHLPFGRRSLFLLHRSLLAPGPCLLRICAELGFCSMSLPFPSRTDTWNATAGAEEGRVRETSLTERCYRSLATGRSFGLLPPEVWSVFRHTRSAFRRAAPGFSRMSSRVRISSPAPRPSTSPNPYSG